MPIHPSNVLITIFTGIAAIAAFLSTLLAVWEAIFGLDIPWLREWLKGTYEQIQSSKVYEIPKIVIAAFLQIKVVPLKIIKRIITKYRYNFMLLSLVVGMCVLPLEVFILFDPAFLLPTLIICISRLVLEIMGVGEMEENVKRISEYKYSKSSRYILSTLLLIHLIILFAVVLKVKIYSELGILILLAIPLALPLLIIILYFYFKLGSPIFFTLFYLLLIALSLKILTQIGILPAFIFMLVLVPFFWSFVSSPAMLFRMGSPKQVVVSFMYLNKSDFL